VQQTSEIQETADTECPNTPPSRQPCEGIASPLDEAMQPERPYTCVFRSMLRRKTVTASVRASQFFAIPRKRLKHAYS
jgi:hypothetical protein